MQSQNKNIALIFVPTNNFVIDTNEPININGYTLIKNKSEEDIDRLFNEMIWQYLGLTFKHSLLDQLFFIKTFEYDQKIQLQKISNVGPQEIELLFEFLWFIKDNSCNAPTIAICTNEGFASVASVSTLCSNASGEFSLTSYTLDDIDHAIEIMQKVMSMPDIEVEQSDLPYDPNSVIKGKAYKIEYNEFDRITRAMHFLKLARNSHRLPQKISFYVIEFIPIK